MIDPTLVQWGRNIKAHRTAKGMRQEDLADLIGVDRSAVSHWEKGDREPGRLNRLAIARALDTVPAVLFPDVIDHREEAVA